MPGSWRKTIAEFVRAAVRRQSYSPHRNVYIIFGFLWGLPIPLFSLTLGFSLAQLPVSPGSFGQLLARQPWQIVFLLHPLVFAAIFGVLGTLYMIKEEQVSRLLEDLRGKIRELNSANRELKELDKMKDEFLSNVSHELKTPLVTIQGYNEMLLSERLGPLTEKQQKGLEVVQRNQARLSDLINQLLRYGKMEERTTHIFQSAFSARKLLVYLQQSFLPDMEKKEIDYQVKLPEEDIYLMGQEDLIEQAVRNLISNAKKFTEPGGWVHVSVDRSEFPEKLGLAVEDNGCGISEDALPFIFERFRQADGSIRRKYGGTGLGLAIVKKILDAHRAPIRVSSRLGEGTRFTIFLPVAKSGSTSAPQTGRRFSG